MFLDETRNAKLKSFSAIFVNSLRQRVALYFSLAGGICWNQCTQTNTSWGGLIYVTRALKPKFITHQYVLSSFTHEPHLCNELQQCYCWFETSLSKPAAWIRKNKSLKEISSPFQSSWFWKSTLIFAFSLMPGGSVWDVNIPENTDDSTRGLFNWIQGSLQFCPTCQISNLPPHPPALFSLFVSADVVLHVFYNYVVTLISSNTKYTSSSRLKKKSSLDYTEVPLICLNLSQMLLETLLFNL